MHQPELGFLIIEPCFFIFYFFFYSAAFSVTEHGVFLVSCQHTIYTAVKVGSVKAGRSFRWIVKANECLKMSFNRSCQPLKFSLSRPAALTGSPQHESMVPCNSKRLHKESKKLSRSAVSSDFQGHLFQRKFPSMLLTPPALWCPLL